MLQAWAHVSCKCHTGPSWTTTHDIKHYLTWLVDNFLDFWHPGVQFSWTDGYKHGRLVHCAIVCIVCNLPVACKTSGFWPSSHSHFCAICHCTCQSHSYGDTNYHLWHRCTKEECLASAKIFNDAETKAEQHMEFASSGVKWSELLHLPYFDPTRFVIIDAMHNLFLGLINQHFQNILGIQLNKDKEQSGSAINVYFIDPWWDTQTVINAPYFSLFLFPFVSTPSDSIIILPHFTLLSSDFPMPSFLPYGFYI